MAKWLAVLLLATLLVAAQPLAEILKLKVEPLPCLLNSTCSAYRATALINASASGQLALGAWALVKGEWKALDWCYPTGSGPCTFVIELKPEYEALGFPLWTNQQGRWVWVQSVDIYGVNAVCTMAYKCPEIDKVEVERGGEPGGGRVRVYVKSPSQRMRVALDIGGMYVEKEVEQPFATACTTLRVDFGPYDFPQGTCGRVRVYGDCGMVERQVCAQSADSNVVVVRVADVVEEKYVKGIGIVKVKAPHVLKVGEEYLTEFNIRVNREELGRLIQLIKRVCQLLCQLPWSKPFMPESLCQKCSDLSSYLVLHGGVRAYASESGSGGVALFLALGLQQTYGTIPAGPNRYLVFSNIDEFFAIYYVVKGLPPLSLTDLESKGVPISLKITPLGPESYRLTGGEEEITLRYKIQLVPNTEYMLNFNNITAEYSKLQYSNDILSRVEALSAAVERAEGQTATVTTTSTAYVTILVTTTATLPITTTKEVTMTSPIVVTSPTVVTVPTTVTQTTTERLVVRETDAALLAAVAVAALAVGVLIGRAKKA